MNYYQLFRLPRTASTEEIKAAYHELARVYHPDSHFYDEIVVESQNDEQIRLYKLITDAYTTLNNAERRANYDRTLPPELKDWETPSNDIDAIWARAKQAKNQGGSGRFAGGFGCLSPEEPLPGFCPQADTAPMSEIFRRRGTMHKMQNLLRAFGIGR